MRRRAPRLLVPLLVALTLACGPAYTDPETRAAARALDMVRALTDLQTATIAAAGNGSLPNADAILIVRFTTSGIRTVQQTPYGWGPSLRTGWTEVKVRFGTHAAVAPCVPVIDGLLLSLGVTP